MSVFDNKVIEFTNEPLFFGTGVNVSRLDLNIEAIITKYKDEAIGLMWFKNDFSYQKDGVDYSNMDVKLQELYLKNH